MQGAEWSMPPNTFTRLIRLRSPSSDSSHSTWDIIDERSGVLSATVAALDRAELLDPHLLAPRRRVLKRPAAQIPRDSFKDRRACPYVLSSPHLGRRLDDSLIHVLTSATGQDEVPAAGVGEHAKVELGNETVEQASGMLAGDDLAATQGSDSLSLCSVCAPQIFIGDTRKYQCTYPRDRLR